MYNKTTHQTPVGTATLASDGASLIGLWLEGQKYFGGSIPGKMIENGNDPVLACAKKWLNVFFDGGMPPIAELPLAPIGSAFRQRVWRILCEIPYGEVTTYGFIAKTVAAEMGLKSMSSQAVGGAVGHNPISIIIPCHRVVGGNGSLTGYAGGIETKIKLLEFEGVALSAFSIPLKGTAL